MTLCLYYPSIPLKLTVLHLSYKTEAERDPLFWVAEMKAVVSVRAADRAINHMSTNGSSKWALSSDKTSALLFVLLQAPL